MLCIDCYTLIDCRDKRTALDFLDAFVPERRAHAQTHHLPRDANPAEVVLDTDDAAMDYLAAHPSEPYVIYTISTGTGEPRWGMVGYTRDGSIVLGLSCDENDPATAGRFFDKLKAYAGTNHGFCGGEYAPPETENEYWEAVAEFGEGAQLLNAG